MVKFAFAVGLLAAMLPAYAADHAVRGHVTKKGAYVAPTRATNPNSTATTTAQSQISTRRMASRERRSRCGERYGAIVQKNSMEMLNCFEAEMRRPG